MAEWDIHAGVKTVGTEKDRNMTRKKETSRLLHRFLSAVILFCLCAVMAQPVPAAGNRVVIDPGHGGGDRGVQLSRNVFEKDVTLAIARQIEAQLAADQAITVVLTRSNDQALSLDARRNAIRMSNADLLLSLHVNAGFGMRASGYEIYVATPGTLLRQGEGRQAVIDDMLRTTYLNNSIRFSNIADAELARLFPRDGRGLRFAPLAIMQDLPLSGVLIELGFASNVRNRDQLLETKTQEAIAERLAESIRQYFGVLSS